MKIIARRSGELFATADIPGDTFYLGRSRQNDLTLANPKISRRHAKIYFEDGQWFLEDLRSDNGTRFKGERIFKTNIRSGDRFFIGPFELEFVANLPDKDQEQVTVTSYIEPSAFDELKEDHLKKKTETLQENRTSPKATFVEEKSSDRLSSGNFLEAISVVPKPDNKETSSQSIKHLIEEHSHNKLENAPASESIHTVVIPEEDTAENEREDPSLSEITSDEDSLKTVIDQSPKESKRQERSLARLVQLDHDHLGEEIQINKDELVFGNDEKSDIRILSDDYPTRKASIKSNDSTFIIESKDSNSGAYVDGVPVKKRELENHDIIQVGKSRFEFLVGDSRSQVKKPRASELSGAIFPRITLTRISASLSLFSSISLCASDK